MKLEILSLRHENVKIKENWKSSEKIQHHVPKSWCSVTHAADVVLGREVFERSTCLCLLQYLHYHEHLSYLEKFTLVFCCTVTSIKRLRGFWTLTDNFCLVAKATSNPLHVTKQITT